MDSSDSEEEQLAQGYQPVLGLGGASAGGVAAYPYTPPKKSGEGPWSQSGVNTYNNTLFKEPLQAAGGARNMQTQKSSLAARRAERMQANLYTSNDGGLPLGNLGSPRGNYSPRELSGGGNQPEREGRPRMSGNDDVYGLRSSFDPNEGEYVQQQQQQQQQQQRTNGNKPESQRATAQGLVGDGGLRAMPPLPPRGDMRKFLMTPGPHNGPVTCFIVREKSGSKLTGAQKYPKYSLYLEEGKRFLLAARKRRNQRTSNYIVSLDPGEIKRDSNHFFGKLRSNFVGSGFTIYDNKEREKAPSQKGGSWLKRSTSRKGEEENEEEEEEDEHRSELGCVLYQYNMLGTRGPRKMTAVIPKVNSAGISEYQPNSPDNKLLERVKREEGFQGATDIVVMHNKTPRWNEELNAYCLNFHGRVTEASVKNFQMVTDEKPGHVILQFGKTGKHSFTMDYQYPMSALQAFCICLSSFDNKLACE